MSIDIWLLLNSPLGAKKLPSDPHVDGLFNPEHYWSLSMNDSPLHHIKLPVFRTAQTCCLHVRWCSFFYFNRNDLFSFLEPDSEHEQPLRDLALFWKWFSLTFLCFFPTQNGQTAEKVAAGASHQDIIDLLKAHAEASSTADLLWAGLTTFYFLPSWSLHCAMFLLFFPSGEDRSNWGNTSFTMWPFFLFFFFFQVFANMPCACP